LGPDYQRLTLTPQALARLDEAVVYARGNAKRKALENLSQDLPLAEQPAQILKRIPKVLIFNDVEGDKYEDSR
jgi:6-phosphogluconolactonase/glucosamine-6-phosphate isomerase/deaminase